MTKADLRDWFMAHGCTIEPLKDYFQGNSVKVLNPKNQRHVYMDMPIDERPVKSYSVCKECMILGIPIPDICKDTEELAKHIKNKHYPNY